MTTFELAAAGATSEPGLLGPDASTMPLRRLGRSHADDRSYGGERTLGEIKARHRELHLCFRCSHHMVCGMAKALDANLLVTIATCLAFESDEGEGGGAVCELLPLEPLPST